MDFRPINSDHAVQSASFSLILDGPISPAAVQALSRRRDLIAELPAVQNPEAFEFNMGASGAAPQPKRMSGVQLAHLRPDGTPAWALRMMGPELAVDCSRYTRWARIWDTARGYLEGGIRAIVDAGVRRKVAVLGHVVADQFEASRANYDLRDALRENRFLASMAFGAGATWHNHVGWFEPVHDSSRSWLNQLNIDVFREPTTARLLLQITHNQEIRLQPPVDIENISDLIDETMNALHSQNKRVLGDILTNEMAKQIGLDLNGQ
ncbi:hypothetical protein [Bradyrhizobium elkanii]|uniref:hypothetical protein n=1 Tax=Bradyrhizobium elkanii TaxID=29448 RepID=UPI0020A1CD8F|nr:hypothetical protein [Bradyrhizobium elkanii]MCP1931789.1 uncharacterized protein (TIGR04255 family) [Bradyrhizobium elkanii]